MRKEIVDTFRNANGNDDKSVQRQILIDELIAISKKHPEKLREALIVSGIDISKNASKKDIALKSSNALFESPEFRKKFGEIVALFNSKQLDGYKNVTGSQLGSAATTVGEGTAAGGQSGNWIVALIGAAIGATEAGFNMQSEKEKAKAEKTKANATIINAFTKDGKINWIPITVIGGVLIIGGIVVYATLKSK